METITVNLITNKKQELKKFLRKYYMNSEYSVSDNAFRVTIIYNSALKALDLITIATEAKEDFLIQVLVSLPELNAEINRNNLNEFIKYIYYRENIL